MINIEFVVKYKERIRLSNVELVDKSIEQKFGTYVAAKVRLERLKDILKGVNYKDGEIDGYLMSVDENIYLLKQYETIVDDSNINNVIRDIQITEILN